MAEIQELVVNEATFVPPRKMEAQPIYLVNRNHTKLGTLLSECLFWMLKAESNDAPGVVSTRNKDELLKNMNFYKAVKENVKKNVLVPTNETVQTELAVLRPTAKEMKNFANFSWEYVALAILNLLEVVASSPDIALAYEIKDESFARIEKAEASVDSAIQDLLMGSLVAPENAALGRLMPSSDFDYERPRRPSSDMANTGYPDQNRS